MKSLNDRYSQSQFSVHETFADLIFCALVVLVLFVMMLAIEVSQRVRAEIASVPEVTVVEDVETLTPEEIVLLSEKLQKQRTEFENQRKLLLAQQDEIETLRERALEQSDEVKRTMSALQGEQRFTGATEPARVMFAYDYRKDRFIFVRQKEFQHATTELSGESALQYRLRQVEELVALALLSRKQRFFTRDEANKIYSAFSTYQQINPTETSFRITNERIAVHYSAGLSGYIAGDQEIPKSGRVAVELAINSNFDQPGPKSDGMHPTATIVVDETNHNITVNGVSLSPKELKDILLSIGGRGVMLDFEGYSGSAPSWLVSEVLEPTGYVGKTPKLPTP